MVDITQTCVRSTIVRCGAREQAGDKKIQHKLCENIHKPHEIQSPNQIYAVNRQRFRLGRFTYGNHTATLVQNPYRQHADGSKHCTQQYREVRRTAAAG
jgi:hypothetical protein